MSQYIMVIIWLGILFLISQIFNVYQREYIYGRKVFRVNWLFAFLAVLPLVYWASVRTGAFFDTNAYIDMFKGMPEHLEEIGTYMASVEKDKGFYFLSALLRVLIGDKARFYLFIVALFQALCLTYIFRKYSSNFFISLFIFIASTDYLSWMHNGIRQFAAVALIFAATDLMIKKKYISMLVIILVASTLHGSALLMIPVIFIAQGRPWNKKTFMAVGGFIIAILFVDKFTNILGILLEETQYVNVISDWESWNDDGTNPIRVLIYAIPTVLSIIGLKYIEDENDPVINLSCNMSIISSLLYFLSAVTSGIFIGRLPIYCSLYSMCILLPWEIEHMFTERSAHIIKVIMIGCFLLFYYFQIHFAWGLI